MVTDTDLENMKSLVDENNELKEKVTGLNRIIALQNEDKLSNVLKEIDKKTSMEKMNLEFFIDGQNMFGGVVISKYVDSDYVDMTFYPNREGKAISIHMTEKAYIKFHEVIDIFKIKSINTRQFEEN